MNKPRLVVRVTFFDGRPDTAWSVRIEWSKKKVMHIADGRLAFDGDVVDIARTWESLGATVLATKYKNGVWTVDKPWLYFKRFKRLAEQNEMQSRTLQSARKRGTAGRGRKAS